MRDQVGYPKYIHNKTRFETKYKNVGFDLHLLLFAFRLRSMFTVKFHFIGTLWIKIVALDACFVIINVILLPLMLSEGDEENSIYHAFATPFNI